MRPDLQKLLHARFPALYIRCDEPPSRSLMGYGFGVGDGWFPIIAALSEVVSAHDETCGRSPTVAAQVKEKFGSLRFYVDGADGYARGAIACAEALSVAFCDRCGRPARTHAFGGLIATVCRHCVEASPDRYGRKTVDDEPNANVIDERRRTGVTLIDPEAQFPAAWLRLLDIVVRNVLAPQQALAGRPTGIVNAGEMGGLLRFVVVCRKTGALAIPRNDESDVD